ncbi:MAG: DegT/DnrJ/EryC1/StrS aminotransferase family protein [Candidatus Magasanikiibacteriota bacterium]
MFSFFKKFIFTGFAPNLTTEDVKTAGVFLFKPLSWKKGEYTGKIEIWLQNYFSAKHSFAFDSGRTALFYVLKSLEIKQDDEVLVQAYTCMVVSNAIVWTGAKPIYIDIDSDFNMSTDDLQKKITPKAKILIIQHTFGKPANLEKLLVIAKQNNLKVIEDCAHSLGAKYNNKLLGTFGDIGMFSFGSDKIISCVRGGGLITNSEEIAKKIKDYQSRLPQSRLLKIKQHLCHYPIFFIGKKLYGIKIGKWLLGIAKKLNLINKIIYNQEKNGKQVLFYPSLLPNALAKILLNQTEKISEFNDHRQTIAKLYNDKINNSKIIKPVWTEESVWLRYNILVKNPIELQQLAKKQNIILGDWYRSPIAPTDIDITKSGYKTGDCPKAEELSAMSINLPTDTNITNMDAERIINLINQY